MSTDRTVATESECHSSDRTLTLNRIHQCSCRRRRSSIVSPALPAVGARPSLTRCLLLGLPLLLLLLWPAGAESHAGVALVQDALLPAPLLRAWSVHSSSLRRVVRAAQAAEDEAQAVQGAEDEEAPEVIPQPLAQEGAQEEGPEDAPQPLALEAEEEEDQLLPLEDGSGAGEDLPKATANQQVDAARRQPGQLQCDFGSQGQETLCDYANSNTTVLKWRAGAGTTSNWLGGPPKDAEDLDSGGYAFFETSERPGRFAVGSNRESAMLESALQLKTPANGQCLQFAYHRVGLSAGDLRVLLHPVPEREMVFGYPADHSRDTVLFVSSQDGAGRWNRAELLYTFPGKHTIVFEAIPCRSGGGRGDTCSPDYRGHIALDAVRVATDGCRAHCTFNGDACGWTADTEADFEWKPSRGSTSRDTGPPSDHGSSVLGGTSGGYLFASSQYPRRPGDRARLLSPSLAASGAGQPRCLRFWLHMFGPGVGTLRVLLQTEDGRGAEPRRLWSLSGPAGNQWYQALVTVTADVQFRLVLEAELGQERLGDMAVDDVTLENGICPAAPQAAASWTAGCTFEVDLCGWTVAADTSGVWQLTAAGRDAAPAADHTTGRQHGRLLRLAPADPPPPGHHARLQSPTLTRPAGTDACLTFRYWMDQAVAGGSGARLGALRVWVSGAPGEERPRLLWQLVNAQGAGWQLARAPLVKHTEDTEQELVLEASWASGGGRQGVIAVDDIVLLEGACEPQPAQSRPAPGDCDFTHDACGWTNTTTDERRGQRWRRAEPLAAHAPRPLLSDHTLRDAAGYVFFDLFSPEERSEKLRLVSPLLEPASGSRGGSGGACVSFWLAHLAPSEPTRLRVLLEESTGSSGGSSGQEVQFGEPVVLWSLSAADTGARRLTWLYAQAGFEPVNKYRVTFEGSASKLGFALDDIVFTAGECEVRPRNATPDEDMARSSALP